MHYNFNGNLIEKYEDNDWNQSDKTLKKNYVWNDIEVMMF